MLKIKEGKDLRNLESLGFRIDSDTCTYWEKGIRKIIIYFKDRRIRFNSMSVKCYDVLFDLIVGNLVEKTDYYKKTSAEDRYATLEKRIFELEKELKEVKNK